MLPFQLIQHRMLLADGWMEMERNEHEMLVASKTKFPSGIKVLANHVKQKGKIPSCRTDAKTLHAAL